MGFALRYCIGRWYFLPVDTEGQRSALIFVDTEVRYFVLKPGLAAGRAEVLLADG